MRFLLFLLGTLSLSVMGQVSSYPNAVQAIQDIIAANTALGPKFVRLAFHSAATYDNGKYGSYSGGIGFSPMRDYDKNNGLEGVIAALDAIRGVDGLSCGDLYTLAGVVAVKVMGGPDVAWTAGRQCNGNDPAPAENYPDTIDAADTGSLPHAATLAGLRADFTRLGLIDATGDARLAVAIMGAHSLGRATTRNSGYNGQWTGTPLVFDNTFFRLLQAHVLSNALYVPVNVTGSGLLQYQSTGRGGIMLPSDIAMIYDASFLPYIRTYANDAQRLSVDFAEAFAKVLALGVPATSAVTAAPTAAPTAPPTAVPTAAPTVATTASPVAATVPAAPVNTRSPARGRAVGDADGGDDTALSASTVVAVIGAVGMVALAAFVVAAAVVMRRNQTPAQQQPYELM